MKKKILYVLQGLGYGGVPSVIVNYYRELSDFFDADFVVKVKQERSKTYIPELEKLGCKIYHVKSFNESMYRYSKEVEEIIKNNRYDIIHDNNKYFAFLTLRPAKKHGVPMRICHVHNTVAANEKNIFHRIFIKATTRLSVKSATHLMACSEQAGKSMFGKEGFTVLNNAIDVSRFRFDENQRIRIRNDLNLDTRFAVITVARFDELKRYDFAFSVFNCLKKLISDAVYIVAGVSEDELQGKPKTVYESLDKDVRDSILLLGRRSDANYLLSAADVFLLASEHEGFGMAVVEAQANGLPCIVSSGVPQSVKVSELVDFMDLLDSPQNWALRIDEIKENRKYTDAADQVANSGFSISECSKQLKDFYSDV